MEIRIRHMQRGTSQLLHEGTLAEARELMAVMRVDGVMVDDLDRTHEIGSQFVSGDDGAYFEILVGGEDA